MPENVRESGQPHKVYTFSLKTEEMIREHLGVIEGMRDFSHPFKFVQNCYDLLRTVTDYKNQGLLINEWKHTEIKQQLDKKALSRFHQIWSGEMYLHIVLDEYTRKCIKESIVFEKPIIQTELDEYYPIPSLQKLIPTEDKEQNGLLIRIGSDIPEKYAYEKTNVITLDTIGGCNSVMPKNYLCSVCGTTGHEAWFSSQAELDSSLELSGGYVTKSYYNKMKDMMFMALDDEWFKLKSNLVLIAKELIGFGSDERTREVPMSKGFDDE